MPKEIYNYSYVTLLDNSEIYVSPLKIKFLKDFMGYFNLVRASKTDDEAIPNLIECVRVAMKQYKPDVKTAEEVEDLVNLPIIYKIIEYAAEISNKKEDVDESKIVETVKDSETSWDNIDLAKLESEVFLIGIWKNYEELETNMSMPELIAVLEQKRENDYNERKFLAALQGVDLDSQSESGNAWEKLKARAYAKAAEISGMTVTDPNDITTFVGSKANQNGFGIGMGISYEKR